MVPSNKWYANILREKNEEMCNILRLKNSHSMQRLFYTDDPNAISLLYSTNYEIVTSIIYSF